MIRQTEHDIEQPFGGIDIDSILSSRGRSAYLPDIQRLMNALPVQLTKAQRKEKALSRLEIDKTCPCCTCPNEKKGEMRRLMPFARGDPPTAEQIKKRIDFLQKMGF